MEPTRARRRRVPVALIRKLYGRSTRPTDWTGKPQNDLYIFHERRTQNFVHAHRINAHPGVTDVASRCARATPWHRTAQLRGGGSRRHNARTTARAGLLHGPLVMTCKLGVLYAHAPARCHGRKHCAEARVLHWSWQPRRPAPIFLMRVPDCSLHDSPSTCRAEDSSSAWEPGNVPNRQPC